MTGDGNLINQGTIIADGSNGDPQRTIDVDIFDNEGIIQIANGAILNLLVQLGESNPPDFYRNFRD